MKESGVHEATGLFVQRTRGPRPASPRTVLAHGFGATGFTWRHGLPALANRAEVLNVDLKGFGRSAKPNDGRYAVRDLASALCHWIEAEVADPFVLVGHSLGGSVALLASLSLRLRGRPPLGVVLVSTPAFPQRLPPFVRFARYPSASQALLRVVGARPVIRAALHGSVFDKRTVGEEEVAAYAEAWSTPEGVRAALACARGLIPDDVDALISTYPELAVPALILHGVEDRVVPPRSAERLADTLPHARLQWIERCGHLPQEERPSETFSAIVSFLVELEGVTSPEP